MPVQFQFFYSQNYGALLSCHCTVYRRSIQDKDKKCEDFGVVQKFHNQKTKEWEPP